MGAEINTGRVAAGLLALTLATVQPSAQEPKWKRTPPVNDLPGPYRRDAAWARLPNGLKWGAVIGAEPGPDGNIYVVHRCHENSCAGRPEPPVFKFDPGGNVLTSWGVGTFIFPHGRYVDPRERVDHRRTGQGREGPSGLQIRFERQTACMTIGTAGVEGDGADNRLRQPTDVVTAPNGDIFVTEGHTIGGGGHRVSKWNRDGKFVKAWERPARAPANLDVPHTIAIDSRGRLFVGDRNNNRIQIFDQDGRFLDEWTQFGRPSGIAITSDDTIYVADSESWGPDEPGWKKGIRVGSARDGAVSLLHRGSRVHDRRPQRSGRRGRRSRRNVYGAVVRRMMLEKHVLIRK